MQTSWTLKSAKPPPEYYIDPLSGTGVRLEMLFQGRCVAVGSGFLWAEGGRTSLVTAWHNVTGTHPDTGQPLSNKATRPDRLRAHFASEEIGRHLAIEIPLYNGDDETALFKTHLTYGRQVDIVAIDVEDVLSSPAILCLAVNALTSSPMVASVGTSAFVIGFPRGLSTSGMPIWKRGTIAAEPSFVDIPSGKENYLLDTATREGMSGAPTFLFTEDSFRDERGNTVLGSGRVSKFLGLYSGRIASQDQLDAQLGIVWPVRLIREVVTKGIADDFTLNG